MKNYGIFLILFIYGSIAGANELYEQCEKLDIKWLQITKADLEQICTIVKTKNGAYSIHSSAPSHQNISNYHMIEIHYFPIVSNSESSGPTYFYRKVENKWQELTEVSGWRKDK